LVSHFNADVELKVVMDPEDLAKAGLDELGKSGSEFQSLT
jgi:hypothetical protein